MSKKSVQNGGCPDLCSGSYKAQTQLTEGQVSRLSVSARERISKSSGIPRRCTYCGCVYIREGSISWRIGTVDGGITGEGWSSADYS